MYKDYEIKLNAILDKHKVQKVDMAGSNINDLKKNLTLVDTLIKEGKNIDAKSIISKINKIVNFLNKSKTSIKKVEKTLDDFADDAKDLGIKPMTIKEYANLDSAWSKLETTIKNTKDSITSIKNTIK